MKKDIKPWIKVLRKMSIHKRLVLTFSLTILIPTMIIAATNYLRYISHIEQMAMKNLELVTDISIKLFQDELNKYETMTFHMNKDEELFAYLDIAKETELEVANRAVGNILYDYANEFNYITNLQIITDDYQFSQINHSGQKKVAL